MSDGRAAEHGGDDLTVASLIRGLWRERVTFLAAFGTVLGLGIVYALSQKTEYAYTTLIQIGVVQPNAALTIGDRELTLSGGEAQPIASAGQVLAVIEEAYIPALSTEDRAADETPIELDVERGRRGIVLLSSRGAEDARDQHRAAHGDIVARLQEAHAPEIKVERKRIQRKLAAARAEVETLVHASAEQKGMGSGAPPAQSGVPDANRVPAPLTSLFAGGTDGQAGRATEVRLAAARAQVQEAKARLAAVKPTRAEALAQRSAEPVSSGAGPVVTLSLAFAVVVGVLMAAGASFVRQVGAAGPHRAT